MKKVTELLKEKKFVLSLEIVPPRNGENIEEVYSFLATLKGKVDFISVTKGAGGSLRGGTLPITYLAQEKYGLNAVSHFVCREHSKQEIENELIDLHYFGIRNILALRGDAPAGAKEEIWNGDYQYAYLLVEQIKKMNHGLYLPTPTMKATERKGLPTDFCILVAGHPEDPREKEIEHLKCKIQAGAEAIITQMIFSFEEYKRYVEAIRAAGINLPVLAGIRPLVDYAQARTIEPFFGIKVDERLMKGLKELEGDKEKARQFGLNYTAEMIRKLKKYGCPGVHLFVLFDRKILDEILAKI